MTAATCRERGRNTLEDSESINDFGRRGQCTEPGGMRAEEGDGRNDHLHLLEITVQLVRLRIALTIKGQVASSAWPFFRGFEFRAPAFFSAPHS
jgi:hypothetical protein